MFVTVFIYCIAENRLLIHSQLQTRKEIAESYSILSVQTVQYMQLYYYTVLEFLNNLQGLGTEGE